VPSVAVIRVALVVLAIALGGCAQDERGDARGEAGRGAANATASPSSTTADPGAWAPVAGPLGRCGPQPPRLAHQRYRTFTLRGAGRILPAVAAGHGRTVVVLVHQTSGSGLCGWLDFAGRIADVPGQTAIAFDLCGYATADCPSGNTTLARQVEQVQLGIDAAVHRFHARRVVLVGASMGGSLTVHTAARDRRVDAAVDLSGPDAWDGARVHRRAADVRVPLLVVMADDEGPQEVAAARATAQAAGPGSTFLPAAHGHGYELLQDAAGDPTPVAERVLAWIAGEAPGRH